MDVQSTSFQNGRCRAWCRAIQETHARSSLPEIIANLQREWKADFVTPGHILLENRRSWPLPSSNELHTPTHLTPQSHRIVRIAKIGRKAALVYLEKVSRRGDLATIACIVQVIPGRSIAMVPGVPRPRKPMIPDSLIHCESLRGRSGLWPTDTAQSRWIGCPFDPRFMNKHEDHSSTSVFSSELRLALLHAGSGRCLENPSR